MKSATKPPAIAKKPSSDHTRSHMILNFPSSVQLNGAVEYSVSVRLAGRIVFARCAGRFNRSGAIASGVGQDRLSTAARRIVLYVVPEYKLSVAACALDHHGCWGMSVSDRCCHNDGGRENEV